jgi:hypothetical protein
MPDKRVDGGSITSTACGQREEHERDKQQSARLSDE